MDEAVGSLRGGIGPPSMWKSKSDDERGRDWYLGHPRPYNSPVSDDEGDKKLRRMKRKHEKTEAKRARQKASDEERARRKQVKPGPSVVDDGSTPRVAKTRDDQSQRKQRKGQSTTRKRNRESSPQESKTTDDQSQRRQRKGQSTTKKRNRESSPQESSKRPRTTSRPREVAEDADAEQRTQSNALQDAEQTQRPSAVAVWIRAGGDERFPNAVEFPGKKPREDGDQQDEVASVEARVERIRKRLATNTANLVHLQDAQSLETQLRWPQGRPQDC